MHHTFHCDLFNKAAFCCKILAFKYWTKNNQNTGKRSLFCVKFDRDIFSPCVRALSPYAYDHKFHFPLLILVKEVLPQFQTEERDNQNDWQRSQATNRLSFLATLTPFTLSLLTQKVRLGTWLNVHNNLNAARHIQPARFFSQN